MFHAVVSWPSAPVTKSLVLNALEALDPPPAVVQAASREGNYPTVFWSSYDDIDHELVHSHRDTVLASSYMFRKALIRKHFLSRCLHSYVTKHLHSPLKLAAPKTFEIELSFVDELEEMFLDELWELGEELDKGQKWWILKPGMADRGNGIRLFNSKASLVQIFEEFEEAESDEDAGSEKEEDSTAVVTSQLRHFVIQEYLSTPLLLDPSEVSINGSPKPGVLQGHKFHLRAYCIASGALEVFLFDKILALFSAVPYTQPMVEKDQDGDPLPVDLTPHLTNTSLQTGRGEEGVRLFQELVSCHILSGGNAEARLNAAEVESIVDQIVIILGETFKAALANPIHFQPLPNAFELFGVDFLVTHTPASSPPFQVSLLEMNAEPAIELTGPRLSWILRDLFDAIARVCVDPFFRRQPDSGEWRIGETRHGLIKCLSDRVRGNSSEAGLMSVQQTDPKASLA